jgi:hypothetical protein
MDVLNIPFDVGWNILEVRNFSNFFVFDLPGCSCERKATSKSGQDFFLVVILFLYHGLIKVIQGF